MNIYSTGHSTSQHKPYTYLIGWSKHDKWYYGARYKPGCCPDDLWITYFTSSRYVAAFRESYGEPDVIQVRRVFETGLQCHTWESKVLHRLNAARDPKWLNRSNGYKNNHLRYPDGAHLRNTLSVKNSDGEIHRISKADFDPSEMTGIAKGKTNVIDQTTGRRRQVSQEELGSNSNLSGVAKGTVVVKDQSGTLYRIDLNDPRYVSGEMVNNRALMCYALDCNGVEHWIKKTDKRLKFKELTFVRDCAHNSIVNSSRKGLVPVRDVNGNHSRISKLDSRYASGELVQAFTKMCFAVDQDGNEHWVRTTDKRLGHSLKITRLCPHNPTSHAIGKSFYLVNGVATRLVSTDPKVVSGEAVKYHPRRARS